MIAITEVDESGHFRLRTIRAIQNNQGIWKLRITWLMRHYSRLTTPSQHKDRT